MAKLIIGIIIAVIVIIGVAYFGLNGTGSNQSSVQLPTTQPTQQTQIPTENPNQKLEATDITVGSGSATVKPGDTITVNYKGTLLNGQQFDSSYDRHQPFTTKIGVGQVIKGWDQGLIGMKVGGVRKLVIPSSLGYGSQGAGTQIPPNATLIFQVELLAINP